MKQMDAFNQQTRPMTTLFLLMSLDGKISTGVDDIRDFDKDLPKIYGVREGLTSITRLNKRLTYGR